MQAEIFDAFCNSIWNCNNDRRTFKKEIKYTVRSDLINTDLGRVFDIWSSIEYKGYRPLVKTKEYDLLIRQKINNIFTSMFDPTVVLNKEYMDLIKTPKRLYHKWRCGEPLSVEMVTDTIDRALSDAEDVKAKYAARKILIPWRDYKILINTYLKKCFNNYKPLDSTDTWTNAKVFTSAWSEDAYCVRYFCRSLSGYIKNYQKEYAGLKRGDKRKYNYCIDCNTLFHKRANRQIRCPSCQGKRTQIQNRLRQQNFRVTQMKNPESP